MNKITNINVELRRLENLVDLDQFYNYLCILNNNLEQATTSGEKLEIMLNLFRNVEKHGL